MHRIGNPPGDQQYIYRNVVVVHPRIPVNQVEFNKNGKTIDSKGHDPVDLTITLNAPAPASGTWVRLDVTPPGNLNSLPPYIRVSHKRPRKPSELGIKKAERGGTKQYSTPFVLTASGTVDAIATETAYETSSTATASFTLQKVATPTYSPKAGTIATTRIPKQPFDLGNL
jgi:hypothetical protein